jgi:uncharacterized RDD family membrane protein YckC
VIPAAERRLVLETAEGVEFSHRLASPLVRGLAVALDLAIVQSVSSAVVGLLAVLEHLSRDFFLFAAILAGFVLSFGYWIFFELRWRGQTPAKRVLGIRVMDVEGRRLEAHQVVLRNLLRVVDQLPFLYLVGAVTGFATSRWQRVGDLVAGTVVVHEPPPVSIRKAGLAEADHGHNSLRDRPHLAKRLRQALGPSEYRIARAALARRDQLDPEARLEVFAALAARIRQMVSLPPEVLEGMSDENLVRGVVEIVEEGR